jgi:ribosomal protein S18 acetylase RimI-like enzyme
MSGRADSRLLAALMVPPAGRAQRLARRYAGAVEGLADRLAIRPEVPDDLDFQYRLYASTRAEEMARVGWPEAQTRAFLYQQAGAQIHHYRHHYPDAAFLVCMQGAEPIGRIYLSLGADELRLMDIALLPDHRGLGLGRVLMAAVVEIASQSNVAIGLHVEPNNPAAAWYRRMGFEQVAEVGAYRFMRLTAERVRTVQLKLIS